MRRSILSVLVLVWCLLPLIAMAQGGEPIRAYDKGSFNLVGRGNQVWLDKELLIGTLARATYVDEVSVLLPVGAGKVVSFLVVRNHVMPQMLAEKYTTIRAYNGVANDGSGLSAKMEVWEDGSFHACVFGDGAGVVAIEPASDGYYYSKVINRRDATGLNCLVLGATAVTEAQKSTSGASGLANGNQIRQYRMALACNHQYADSVAGSGNAVTKALVLSKIVTSLNRVNGVFEKELAISMQLIDHEDTLLFTDAASDPFGALNDNPSGLVNMNQIICDSLIGNANYDIGHIFSTGGGGLSQVGNVCHDGLKAQSVTGSITPYGVNFDIDYVVHEIGHEFGANHSFNDNSNKSCSGNAYPPTAVEPGSGSTIMCYAGICGPDNIQPHSDAYFSAMGLKEIVRFVTGTGNACATLVPSGNRPVGIDNFTSYYSIPYLTPFELTAPASADSVGGNAVQYCWEQWNFGDFGRSLVETSQYGPLFRSYLPDTSPTRVFPNMALVLADSLSNAGNDNAQGEKLPDVGRFLTFRLTVRNQLHGFGCFLFPDDSVHLDVINTSRRFRVTSQAEPGAVFLGGTNPTVTWDVANTDAAPVNAANVDIYLSGDGGATWPYYLGTFPNNGSATVPLPNPVTTIAKARFKVKGSGNVFFQVNKADFSVFNNNDTSGVVNIFPVPAHNSLNIVTGQLNTVSASICNAIGRTIWRGDIAGIVAIDVSYWPRGVYFARLSGSTGSVTVRKIAID